MSWFKFLRQNLLCHGKSFTSMWLQVSLTKLILLGETSNMQSSIIINCVFLILWVTIMTLPLIQSEVISEHIITYVYPFETLTHLIFPGVWHRAACSALKKSTLSIQRPAETIFQTSGCNLERKLILLLQHHDAWKVLMWTLFCYGWQCGTEVPDSDRDWRKSPDLSIFAAMSKDVRWHISTILVVGCAGRTLGIKAALVSMLIICCIAMLKMMRMGGWACASRLCFLG